MYFNVKATFKKPMKQITSSCSFLKLTFIFLLLLIQYSNAASVLREFNELVEKTAATADAPASVESSEANEFKAEPPQPETTSILLVPNSYSSSSSSSPSNSDENLLSRIINADDNDAMFVPIHHHSNRHGTILSTTLNNNQDDDKVVSSSSSSVSSSSLHHRQHQDTYLQDDETIEMTSNTSNGSGDVNSAADAAAAAASLIRNARRKTYRNKYLTDPNNNGPLQRKSAKKRFKIDRNLQRVEKKSWNLPTQTLGHYLDIKDQAKQTARKANELRKLLNSVNDI